MKCTNRILSVFLILMMLGVSGCGKLTYSMDYDAGAELSSLNILPTETGSKAKMFASELCVVNRDIFGENAPDLTESLSAVLFDVSGKEVLYAKNANLKLYPASLTKVMTALVALKNASSDMVLHATENVIVTESNAQIARIKAGDSMTLDQALRILLLYSANDVANMIAENVGGSIPGFVAMMNAEAAALGATHTHFMNPNGLTDEEHYTTAYDLYLIFHEAMKYDTFTEIISMASYETVYYNGNGNEVKISVNNTNGYVSGTYTPPAGVTVIGGKTGTTAAAGHCLILLARDSGGNPYISVILDCESTEALYRNMNGLLGEIQ